MVLGVYPSSIKRGSTGSIEIHGLGLPPGLAAEDLDLGPGISVTRVSSSSATLVSADISVDQNAADGGRDVFLSGLVSPDRLVVFNTVDRVVVTPETGMARVGGGGAYPKGFAQFEARGFSNGPDDKPDTDDDLDLGLLDVQWSMEEYAAAFGDDDLAYIGTLGQDGLFLPALDGPNPDRLGSRNNIGDVWVVATHSGPDGKAVRGRAHLLVTVPLYMRWEPWRMSEPIS